MNYEKQYKQYLGKEFKLGVQDCYTIVREFFKNEFGIILKNYARYEGFWKDRSLYRDYFKHEGFVLLDEYESLQKGDIIIVSYNSKYPSHALIYLGETQILHHPTDKKSTLDTYRSVWKNLTSCVVRHKSMLKRNKI